MTELECQFGQMKSIASSDERPLGQRSVPRESAFFSGHGHLWVSVADIRLNFFGWRTYGQYDQVGCVQADGSHWVPHRGSTTSFKCGVFAVQNLGTDDDRRWIRLMTLSDELCGELRSGSFGCGDNLLLDRTHFTTSRDLLEVEWFTNPARQLLTSDDEKGRARVRLQWQQIYVPFHSARH
ncbi:MAG: hypothetical protein M1826_007308 [Phylliscum demangeonii]|nr:MAG: hypothetical protein M1826_007308 [Phylliscum demangeonii]